MNVFQRYLAEGKSEYYVRFRAPDPANPRKTKQFLRNTGQTEKMKALAVGRKLAAAAQDVRWASVDDTKMRSVVFATVGEIVAAYRKATLGVLGKGTVKGNIAAMGRIIQGVHGADYSWEDASSSILTAKLLLDFQAVKLAQAGENKLAQARARIGFNAAMRMAKSFFSKRLGHAYDGLQLPDLTSFKSVMALPEGRQSYQAPSRDLEALTMKAALDGIERNGIKYPSLKDSDPSAYIVFLLAGALGMRAGEIAHARYSWIEPHGEYHAMNIRTGEDFAPKGRDDRTLFIDNFVHGELMQFRQSRITALKGPDYILPGSMTERTDKVFRRFSAFMKSLGWTTHKKAHELRKLFGSMVARKEGLFVAQKLLGHKDPKVTSQYYAGLLDLPQITFAAGLGRGK